MSVIVLGNIITSIVMRVTGICIYNLPLIFASSRGNNHFSDRSQFLSRNITMKCKDEMKCINTKLI